MRERGVISVALHPGWVQNDISGTRAILTPDESAAMLAKVIAGLTIAYTGKFFEPDGSELPLITQQFADKPYSMPKGRPVLNQLGNSRFFVEPRIAGGHAQ